MLDAGLKKELDGSFHPGDPRQIQGARLVALGRREELDLRLCHESRCLDVPGSKQRRAAKLKVILSDKHNTDRQRTKKPFVRIGAQEVDVLNRRRERPKSLYRIEREQNPASAQQLSNACDIDSVARYEVTGGKSDQPGLWAQSLLNQFRRDRTGHGRFEESDGDSAGAQVQPGVDVCRVVIQVTEDFVALPPIDPVGNETESKRRGSKQGDFLWSRMNQPRSHFPGLLNQLECLIKVWSAGRSGPGEIDHRVGHRPRKGCDRGVGHKDFVFTNRESVSASLFVSQDRKEKVHGMVKGKLIGLAQRYARVREGKEVRGENLQGARARENCRRLGQAPL